MSVAKSTTPAATVYGKRPSDADRERDKPVCECTGMNATSLARPRRWTVDVDGIRWLPRMIDKARMKAAGSLGAYLLGHSPVDRSLLQRLKVTTDEFAAIVASQPDDHGVLTALRARGFDEASVRRWSDRFETTWRMFIPLWDLDEGYRTPTVFEMPFVSMMRVVEGPLMDALRKVSKAP